MPSYNVSMIDPLGKFQLWYADALKADPTDADAMALATCSHDGLPTVRILYFRKLIHEKFCFFTNYESRKGRDIAENPRAAAVFLWHKIKRQVNIEGPVEKLSESESDEYFSRRPFESRLSAASSKQSQKLSSHATLLSEIESNRKLYSGEIPRPSWWGGYAIVPTRIEFWEAGEHRRHKREVFRRVENNWEREFLYP